MKRLLLFFTLIIISAWNLKAQQDDQDYLLGGEWFLEKAEYMELTSPSQTYQVKHEINSEEGLFAYSACMQEVVRKAIFCDNETAIFESLFTQFFGKYQFITPPPTSTNKQSLMQLGSIEDMGKDSSISGRKYNSPGILYKIEYIDENSIGVILEKSCCDENFVITQAAIKCILKRRK